MAQALFFFPPLPQFPCDASCSSAPVSNKSKEAYRIPGIPHSTSHLVWIGVPSCTPPVCFVFQPYLKRSSLRCEEMDGGFDFSAGMWFGLVEISLFCVKLAFAIAGIMQKCPIFEQLGRILFAFLYLIWDTYFTVLCTGFVFYIFNLEGRGMRTELLTTGQQTRIVGLNSCRTYWCWQRFLLLVRNALIFHKLRGT